MDDAQLLQQIEGLVEEERELRERAGKGEMADEAHARLASLEIGLDRAWDLLRQRRALRRAGDDPDKATERSADIVEKYWQ